MKMQYVLSVSQLARSTLFSMVGMRLVYLLKTLNSPRRFQSRMISVHSCFRRAREKRNSQSAREKRQKEPSLA